MIVIADTSPLNYLIRLGHVDVLPHLYGRVLVPAAVLIELRHADAPPEVRDWIANPPSWLEATDLQRVDASLPIRLGAGEREAISLALEVRAKLLLIDERAGRLAAEARQISVAGTLAVLSQAASRGYVDLPAAVEQLRRFGFRISTSLVARVLAQHRKSTGKDREQNH